MTPFLRHLARSILPSAALLALCVPGFCSTAVPREAPGGYGSYLAGEEALRNLSTGDAARYLRDANAAQNDPVVEQRAFLAYLANGDIDRAVVVANRLLADRPDFLMGKLVVAISELKDRRYGAVEKLLDGMPTDDFVGISAGIIRAWSFIGDGRKDDAVTTLARASKPGLEGFINFHQGLMDAVAGDGAAAVTLAGKAYESNSTAPRMVEAYARALGNADRFDDALAIIDRFNAQGLGDPQVDAVQKALLAHQHPGLFATSAQAGASELLHGIAIELVRNGDIDDAMALLQLGLYLDPRDDGIPLLIGQLLDNAGQHAAANGFYASIPDSSPMNLTAQIRIAQNYDDMNNRPEALQRLAALAAKNPDNRTALTALGEMLRTDKQYDAAAKAYSQALALDKTDLERDWVLYYQRGIAYERANEWTKAEPDFLKALALEPDQPQVLNYLGYTWVDRGVNLDKGFDMIQRAVKATPNDGFIVDSLGWAYFKLNKFDNAVTTLEQAVQLKPNDPQINDHLGDAYWKAGRKLEAHFQWNIAASLDTDGTLKTSLAAKQANGLDKPATTSAAATPTTTQ